MSTITTSLTTNGQRTTIGDFELTVFSDGNYWLDGGSFFGIIPKVLWQKKITADERNRVVTGENSVLVRTDKHSVLIETGIGNKIDARMAKIYEPQSKLFSNLTAGGVDPEEIDIVINTHLHFDHCGWNTVRKNHEVVAAFPRAKYFVQKGEWEYGKVAVRDRVSYLTENYDPLIECGQMHLIDGDREIVPGISVKVFPGHTRHMQAVMIESGGKCACYISDLIPTTHHLDLLWAMAYDLFPLQVIENKKRFYAEAVPNKWLVIFTHDPAVPWCYVEKTTEGRYVAVGNKMSRVG